jgi:sialate O-acetylesterase
MHILLTIIKISHKTTILICIAACWVHATYTQTTLPNYFSDSMVLQQQSPVAIWGHDKPNTKISIKASWGSKAQTVADEKGNWKLKIHTPNAGGPFIVQIKGSTKILYQHVLVGEVWLCSGQSNMEMPVKGNMNQPVLGSNEVILNSFNPNIRCFTVPRSVSKTNATNADGYWKSASPANTGNFSATAYFFAKKVHALLGVPIGIIHTSWGASNIESWMDSATLAAIKQVKIPETVTLKEANTTPTMLYKSMLHPFIGYGIRGVLWYQGEGNRERAKEYQALLPALIRSWRTQWQQGDFPFYFAQIAPHSGLPKSEINGAFLREAQLKTMLTVENTGMAVTMDIGEQFLIHPAQKEMVGNRLAYWALAKDYHIDGIGYSGPVYDKIERIKNDTITISFKYANLGLTSFGKPLTDFEIAGEGKVFYPANAFFTKGKAEWVSVTSDSVKNPVSVRYGFKNWVQGCLYNTQGLPASSFRTDDW